MFLFGQGLEENGAERFLVIINDEIDTPFIVVLILDLLHILDILGVVMVNNTILIFDCKSLHITLELAEFPLVIQKLAETEEVVLQVETVNVELDVMVVGHQGAGEREATVAGLEAVENLEKEFLVSHIS